MDKKENNRELRVLIFGEAAVAVLTVAGAFLVSLFSEYVFGFSAVTGALLGALIVVLNFAFLSLSVNRAVDEYLAVRGSREMTDEEAEKFANENSMAIQNAIKTSFLIRTFTMIAALALAFITGVFDTIATVVPLLMYRPILSVSSLLKAKLYPEPEAEYATTAEINETKEDNE
jgi:uncharacterized membrane protein